MNIVDWSKTPKDAEFYANGFLYKTSGSTLYSTHYAKYLKTRERALNNHHIKTGDKWVWSVSFHDPVSIKMFSDYTLRPKCTPGV